MLFKSDEIILQKMLIRIQNLINLWRQHVSAEMSKKASGANWNTDQPISTAKRTENFEREKTEMHKKY